MSFSIIPGIRCSVNAWSDVACSLLLGDNLNLLSDGEGSLLPVDHDLEALKVGEVLASGSLGELLRDGHGGPLGDGASEISASSIAEHRGLPT